MTKREEMAREEIAKELTDMGMGRVWNEIDKSCKTTMHNKALAILNLTDSKGNKLLGIIAEDQSLPENPYENWRGKTRDKHTYKEAQQHMLKAGFVKLIKGEKS